MFVLLVSIALLAQDSSARQLGAEHPTATDFHFPSFKSTDCSSHLLLCTGSVKSTNDGFLSLTPEDKYQVGRVMCVIPIDASSKRISTSFTFRIVPPTDSLESGDGLAFIMASDTSPSPGTSDGSYIGIMDPTKDGSVSGQLAVEFDTYKNHKNNDIDANHVSIMTQSLANPLVSKSFNDSGINLKSGKKIDIKINIHNGEIVVSAEEQKHSKGKGFATIVKLKIDILKVLPSTVYVGFTSATGEHMHKVISCSSGVFHLHWHKE